MVDAINVSIADVDLVCLYRYTVFDTAGAEVLDNVSQSPVYTGLNTMSVSGATKVKGPGSNAPWSSGGQVSGGGIKIFHLPYSPAQSGNASGIDCSTTQDFSFGGWVLSPYTAFFKDFMGKFAFANGMRSYRMMAHTGAGPPTKFWRVDVGLTNGNSSVTVNSPFSAVENTYEHVVCTVDTDAITENIRLYISGILVATGDGTIAPGTSGAHPPFRLFGNTSATSEGVLDGVASMGGDIAETFLIRRTLSNEEVSGIYQSGFTAPVGSVSDSDAHDRLKDNQASGGGTGGSIVLTAWDASDGADPSGVRHTTSGFHPAFIKILDVGGGSGVDFGIVTQGTPSSPRAITFRSDDVGKKLHNMRIWASDLGTFDGIIGYEPTLHINSKWLPNLILPSGSGVVGRSLGAASSILRSDGLTSISGSIVDTASQSGEADISQYVYLALDSSSDMTVGSYGPANFTFMVTYDTESV